MYKLHTFLLLLAALCLSFVRSAPAYADGAVGNANTGHDTHQNTLLSDETDDGGNTLGDNSNNINSNNYDKRVERYAFGLGRRSYMFTNGGAGMKRLPVYNFGLGKRSQPYSFGLGKRSDYDDEQEAPYEGNEYEHYNGNGHNAAAYMGDEKRNRPYSFGLGKRQPDEVERRFPNRYGFGLGRR